MKNQLISILKNNSIFFSIYFLFLIIGGIFLLTIEQGDAVLFFSDNRNPFADFYFTYGTKLGEEPAYFIFAALLFFINRKAIWTIPVAGLTVMGLSYLLKQFFGQPRPSLWFQYNRVDEQINVVEGVQLLSGASSFPSGHTMSAFALYGLLAFLVKDKKITGFILAWIALTIGVSRVYLVQHFLRDIYAGSIIGVLVALVVYLVFEKTHKMSHA